MEFTSTEESPAPSTAGPADTTLEHPQRGGSYTRNADGTLTQTEGHGLNQSNQE